jgi:imidazolonepropionase-like amidohydrolase
MLAALASLALLCSSASPGVEDALVVRAKTLYVGDGRVLHDAVVVILGGKIAFVGAALPSGTKVREELNVDQAVVTPGFVEGSSYAGLARGALENEEGRETTPGLRVASALNPASDDFDRLLDQGVTTIVVCPGTRNVFGGLSIAVKPRGGSTAEMTLKEDVATLAVANRDPTVRNSPPGRGFFRAGAPGLFNRRPNTRMGVVFELRRALQEGAGRASGGPWSPMYDETDGPALARAVRGDVPVAFLASNETDALAAIRIAEEFGVKKYWLQDAGEAVRVRAKLAAKKIPALIGPTTFQEAPNSEGDRAGLMAAPKALADAGVLFGISRGSWQTGTTLRDGAEAAARGGLEPGRAIAAVTGDPAKIVGVADRVGTIEVGKDADLLVFAGDPLSPATRLAAVILDGKIVRRDDARTTETGK